ncbi:elongation factor P maturation arginine rhamnosyltransferase EarP [Succinimonas sp.]|uniref:elongation factor P maturation arginine rhamnosyltransferase EarP n=1 Tax=Succinimonas sp. TaxID=1936151 RepID=UPI0038674316
MTNDKSIDIFCQVIDNYGDAGVTYRLARILSTRGYTVTLFIDNFRVLKKLNPGIDDRCRCNNEMPSCPQKQEQLIANNLKIRFWMSDDAADKKDFYREFCYKPAGTVIEAFQCRLPDVIIRTFAATTIWINLDYLSAEEWVESCHELPSLQNNNISKFFFFPGFTNKTGGLNFEEIIYTKSKEEAISNVTRILHISQDLNKFFKVLIFTYENESLIHLIRAITNIKGKTMLFLPEGRSTEFLKNNSNFIKLMAESQNITAVSFKMLPQEQFNDVLKAMDLNVIRGEDSFAQANMTGVPFIWHIYRQDEGAHLIKLKAFTDLYTADCLPRLKETIEKAFTSLNDSEIKRDNEDSKQAKEALSIFCDFMIKYPEICALSAKWAEKLFNMGNLSTHLDSFIQKAQNNLKVNK